jgi:hypothetical protein
MKKRFIMIGMVVIASTALQAHRAQADKRNYVWTYQYSTLERGETEIESYTTLSSPDIDHLQGTVSTEHQIELEVGMTDHFDFGVYQMFEQAPGGPLFYKGYKLRARYRLGDKDRYVVDPLVYAEYKGKPDFSTHTIELKLILAKDIGRVNFALNPILELEKKDTEWEAEPEYALALSYGSPTDVLRLGLEFKGGENGHYAGPVISHGSENTWVAFGSAVKLTHIDQGRPEFELRLLIGVRMD